MRHGGANIPPIGVNEALEIGRVVQATRFFGRPAPDKAFGRIQRIKPRRLERFDVDRLGHVQAGQILGPNLATPTQQLAKRKR